MHHPCVIRTYRLALLRAACLPRRAVPAVGDERPDDVLDKRTRTLWCQQPAIHLRFSFAYMEAREDARPCAMGALQGAGVALCAPT
jgi:hypothetical protein